MLSRIVCQRVRDRGRELKCDERQINVTEHNAIQQRMKQCQENKILNLCASCEKCTRRNRGITLYCSACAWYMWGFIHNNNMVNGRKFILKSFSLSLYLSRFARPFPLSFIHSRLIHLYWNIAKVAANRPHEMK